MANARVPANPPQPRDQHADDSPRVSGNTDFPLGTGRRAAGPEAGGLARVAAGPAGAGQIPLGNPRTILPPGDQPVPRPSYRLGLTAGDLVEQRLDACGGVVLTPEASVILEQLLAYQGRRRSRHKLRRLAQKFTGIPRLTSCGQTTVTGTGAPVLRVSGTSAGYAGISTCGSVWVCTVCAAKVAARRSEQLATIMRKVLDSGGSASLITLTVRHHRGTRLDELWDAINYAWSKVTSGRQYLADQEVGGMLGWVRVVEATHGHNGWHPHIHALVCWRDRISAELAQEVGDSMHARWHAALQRKGFESWRDQGGLDVRMADLKTNNLADYFVKIAREVTSQSTKETRKGRPQFAILRDIGEHYLADDADLWAEWEQASLGKKQLTWSRGQMDLRKWAEIDDLSDEEIAAEELDGDDVVGLTPETWGWLVANEQTTELLDAAELGGPDGAIAWLTTRQLTWIEANSSSRPPPVPDEAKERHRQLWRPSLWKLPN